MAAVISLAGAGVAFDQLRLRKKYRGYPERAACLLHPVRLRAANGQNHGTEVPEAVREFPDVKLSFSFPELIGALR